MTIKSNWINRAKVGDKVRYLGGDNDDTNDSLTEGAVYVIDGIQEGGVAPYVTILNNRGMLWYIDDYDCKNVRSFELIEDESKSTEDMLVSLSQEVARIKKELADLRLDSAKKEDVEKFAETAEEASYKAGQALTATSHFSELHGELADKIELVIDDIVTLDERTQPLVDEGVSTFATELAEMIERKINESYRKGRI